MMYWVHWIRIVEVRALSDDGRLDCTTEKWIEWRPEMTAADGW